MQFTNMTEFREWKIETDADEQTLIYLSDSVAMKQHCFETQIAALAEIGGFPSLLFLH